jgi:hypothetical protein
MHQLEREALKKKLIDLVPTSGSIGSGALLAKFRALGECESDEDYWLVRKRRGR